MWYFPCSESLGGSTLWSVLAGLCRIPAPCRDTLESVSVQCQLSLPEDGLLRDTWQLETAPGNSVRLWEATNEDVLVQPWNRGRSTKYWREDPLSLFYHLLLLCWHFFAGEEVSQGWFYSLVGTGFLSAGLSCVSWTSTPRGWQCN